MSDINWRGLAVDIIRRLWDRGLYRDNKILQQVHDNWLGHWLDYRTKTTMRSADQQLADMKEDPTIPDPLYWEEGGTIGFTYEFTDDDS